MFAIVLLGGCHAAAPVTAAPPAAQRIDAGHGSTVTVNVAAVARDGAIEAHHDPRAVETPAAGAWHSAQGVLDVHIAHPLTATSPGKAKPLPSGGADANMQVEVPYATADAGAVTNAHATLVTLQKTDGSQRQLVLAGSFDSKLHKAIVNIPTALLRDVKELRVFLALDPFAHRLPPLGPRYWNGRGWSQSGSFDPHKRTLVMVHGIFSSVERSYPCAAAILHAGGYEQGIGFDYDWAKPPIGQGRRYATFLQGLVDHGLKTFDLEAHSYGSVVTLAALPEVASHVRNVILLGGPLPPGGASLAANPLFATVLGILATEYLQNPSLVYRAFSSGMVGALTENSATLRAIYADVKALPNPPHFIQIAGTRPFSAESSLDPVLDKTVQLPWDGVVEWSHAMADIVKGATRRDFPVNHSELICKSPAIIDYVASSLER